MHARGSSLAPRPAPSSTAADYQIRGRPAPVALLMDHGQLHAESCEPSNRPQSQDTRNRVPAPIRLGPRVSPSPPLVGRPWRMAPYGCDAGRHNFLFNRQRGSGEKPLGRPVEHIARRNPHFPSPDARILDPGPGIGDLGSGIPGSPELGSATRIPDPGSPVSGSRMGEGEPGSRLPATGPRSPAPGSRIQDTRMS